VRIACLLALVALFVSPQIATENKGVENCGVTRSTDTLFVPPSPYLRDTTPPRMFWYGSEQLWTVLDSDATWSQAPLADYQGFRTKLTYWSTNFDRRTEPEPKLTVTAQRLDHESPVVVGAPAFPVFIRGPMPAAMMTAVDIPASGCWKITAQYRDQKLSFVRSIRIQHQLIGAHQ
jgi:hypothetical protein